MPPRISVIVPAFNAAADLAECLGSAIAEQPFELICIDDGSTDASWAIAAALPCTLLHMPRNSGPGIARNRGLDVAQGDWVVFLDSDDRLLPGALTTLADFIARNPDCDAVTHDGSAAMDRATLIRRSLSLHLDGSVVFTAIRRSLIEAHRLRFAAGLHEDVDFLFRVQWHAHRVGALHCAIYDKRRRPGSIVETISPVHTAGFARAWRAIGTFVAAHAPEHLPHWRTGLVALLATRLRAISRLSDDPGPLHAALLAAWQSLLPIAGAPDLQASDSQYARLARAFLASMEECASAEAVQARLRPILASSWSCTDLHHSVFLAPTQIRTCCKRFFRDGAMQGDAVLFDVAEPADASAERILAAKRSLHTAINRDDPTACTGCPFLEFKDWGPLAPLSIQHLSLEYHSVCDLRCSYCSETYHGGARPRYDVAALVEALPLHEDATVVWGGGEPTLSPGFAPIAEQLATRPGLTQRVLTNATKHSATLERLLAAGRVTITTSIDAGTPETFARIRGRDRMARVLRNLQRYAAADAEAVTIKYIFTEGNATLAECRAFVDALRDAGLLRCGVQISRDFKQETVGDAALLPITALHGLLVQAGCPVVFFDDLLRQRLLGLDAATTARLKRDLAAEGLHDVLAEAEAHPDYAIWGAGWQTRYLLEHASFLRARPPRFLVDATPAKIGTRYLGLPVHDPRALLRSDMPVLIAAVQAYPAIRRQFLALGLAESRLVRAVGTVMVEVDLRYLNLADATARRDAFEANYTAHGFASHWHMARFHAIDASHELVRNAPGTLSPGNKGCIFSSLECLREHFDSDRHLYILDDDIVFAATAQAGLDMALAALGEEEWDILYTDTIIPNAFDMPRLMMQRHEHGLTGELALWNLAAPGFTFCAGSSLINRRAKRKIHALMHAERHDTPWDLVMRQHIQAGRVRALLVFPFLTAASRLGDESQITPDNPHRHEHSFRNAFRRMLWLGETQESTDDMLARFNAILAPLLAIQTQQRWFRRAA